MTTAEAVELLHDYEGPDRERIMAHLERFGPWPIDIWPMLVVAGVRLVGWLEDCETVEQLREAWAHFKTCLSAKVFRSKHLTDELVEVAGEWDRHTARLMGASA